MTEQTSPQRRGEALGGLVALAAVVLLVVGAVTALDSCKKDDTQTDAADAGNLDVPFGGCGDADPNEFAVQAPHDPSVVDDAGTRANYFAVWGASENAIWAVGSHGRIVFWDGTTWTQQQTPTDVQLTSVWGVSDEEVWAVGFDGTVLRYSGGQWLADQMPPDERFFENDAGPPPAPDVGTTVTEAGPRDAIVTSPRRNLWGVFAAGKAGTAGKDVTDAVYVAGDRGTVLHWQNNVWTRIDSGVEEKLTGIWGTSATNVYIVGDFGTVLKGGLAGFTEEQTNTDKPLRGVWGRGDDDVYAVGLAGTIVHRNGGTWTDLPNAPKQFFRGVWGRPGGSNPVYVVGWDGVILKVSGGPGFANGATFSPFFCTTQQRLEGIWGLMIEVPAPAPDGGVLPGQDLGTVMVPRTWAVGVNGTIVTGP
ncbi:MAG: hypothetical protein KC503_09830 [Myxococcales bacterium]|nr:hypothetical protein [Myxococcales bacterium]